MTEADAKVSEPLLNRSPRVPFDHQVVGVEELVKWTDPAVGRSLGGCYFIADEMRLGKSRQVIDAAQLLYDRGELDRVVIVALAASRDPVWYDDETSEIAKWLWRDMAVMTVRFRNHLSHWARNINADGRSATGRLPLNIMVTNYDFIRSSESRTEDLCEWASSGGDGKSLLILDESSAVKSAGSRQFKSCLEVRKHCDRVWLLNGTPVSHSPMDLFAQAYIMHPDILGFKNKYEFQHEYGKMGGFGNRSVVRWRRGAIEDIQKKLKPYMLRRIRTQCSDMPEKLDAVTHEVQLERKTWDLYVRMKEDMIAWLDQQTVAVAAQAGNKVMRLAQITSGYLGGLKTGIGDSEEDGPPDVAGQAPPWIAPGHDTQRTLDILAPQGGLDEEVRSLPPREVGREKLNFWTEWIRQRIEEEPTFKFLLWCRFRPEAERYHEVLSKLPGLEQTMGKLVGGQSEAERKRVLSLLRPGLCPVGAAGIVGTIRTGAKAFDLSAADVVVFSSNDLSLELRQQAEDRGIGPERRGSLAIMDTAAVGERGQHTIDHRINTNLQKRRDMANYTCSAWIRELSRE